MNSLNVYICRDKVGDIPPLLYVLTCVRCCNSKLLSRISFKHVFGSGEEHYFKVTLNSNNNKVMATLRLEI